MEERCPHIKRRVFWHNDKSYDAPDLCDLNDKICLLEERLDCEEWKDIQKEWKSDDVSTT